MSVRCDGLPAACLLSVQRSHGRRSSRRNSRSRTLDEMEDISAWKSLASDGVSASVHRRKGVEGSALVLEFDLAKTAGYAAATRQLPASCPRTTRFRSGCAARPGRNHFEVKFVDASGDNVWWFRRANYQFSGDWQQVRIKRRQIEFAWGPTTDETLRQFASIEFVVAAGDDGGNGQSVVRSAGAEAAAAAARRSATDRESVVRSDRKQRGARARRQDEHGVAQRANRRHDAADVRDRPARHVREFGGIEIDWPRGLHAPALYDRDCRWTAATGQTVRTVDRRQWRPRFASAAGVRGALHPAHHAGSGPRRRHRRDPRARSGVRRVAERVHRVAGQTEHAAAAIRAPYSERADLLDHRRRRWRHEESLLSEDGAIEVRKGSFSIEPFVRTRRRRWLTWADVSIRHSLADGYLPIPTWSGGIADVELTTTAIAGGADGSAHVRVDLPRAQSDRRVRQKADARARRATVPGQSAGAVPQHRGRRQSDPGSRMRGQASSTSMVSRACIRARRHRSIPRGDVRLPTHRATG